MPACRRVVEIREAVVAVSFAIVVEVLQPRDLIATEDINIAVEHLQPQWLEQPRGEAFPGQLLQCPVDSGHAPHIAVDRTEVGRLQWIDPTTDGTGWRKVDAVVKNRALYGFSNGIVIVSRTYGFGPVNPVEPLVTIFSFQRAGPGCVRSVSDSLLTLGRSFVSAGASSSKLIE